MTPTPTSQRIAGTLACLRELSWSNYNSNIIEGLLEPFNVYGNSPRVTVTPCIEELYLLSIKIQGCQILPTLGTPLGE